MSFVSKNSNGTPGRAFHLLHQSCYLHPVLTCSAPPPPPPAPPQIPLSSVLWASCIADCGSFFWRVTSLGKICVQSAVSELIPTFIRPWVMGFEERFGYRILDSFREHWQSMLCTHDRHQRAAVNHAGRVPGPRGGFNPTREANIKWVITEINVK